MAAYALIINVSSDTISWATGTIPLSSGNRVLACTKSTDNIYWSSTKPLASTDSILVCESTTDVISWGSPDDFAWSV